MKRITLCISYFILSLQKYRLGKQSCKELAENSKDGISSIFCLKIEVRFHDWIVDTDHSVHTKTHCNTGFKGVAHIIK